MPVSLFRKNKKQQKQYMVYSVLFYLFSQLITDCLMRLIICHFPEAITILSALEQYNDPTITSNVSQQEAD